MNGRIVLCWNKKDEGPTNGRIGIRPKKKDWMKKDVCLTNGRLGFGQKNGQKQKSLHPSQLWQKRWGLNEW